MKPILDPPMTASRLGVPPRRHRTAAHEIMPLIAPLPFDDPRPRAQPDHLQPGPRLPVPNPRQVADDHARPRLLPPVATLRGCIKLVVHSLDATVQYPADGLLNVLQQVRPDTG